MRQFLILLIVLSTLTALFAAHKRYRVEMANRTVCLTVDYTETQQLVAAYRSPGQNNLTVVELLTQLRNVGVRAVAIPEETLGSLLTSGEMWFDRGDPAGPTRVRVSERVAERVRAALTLRPNRAAANAPTETHFVFPDGESVHVAVPLTALLPTAIGLNPEAVDTVRAANLEPIARLQNTFGANDVTILESLRRVKAENIETVIFSGDQVLGARNAINTTAATMQSYDLEFGSIEFGKQAGDAALAKQLEDNTIRVHSISSAEADNLAPSAIIERFVRSAAERNIRICYVRFMTNAADDPIEQNLANLEQLANGMQREGFRMGSPEPFNSPGVPGWVMPIIALGVAAAIWLLADQLFKLDSRWVIALSLLSLLLVLAGVVRPGQKINALIAALVFPTLALVAFLPKQGGTVSFGSLVARFALITGVSVVGAIHVVGLLATRAFLIKIDQFAGIKLAHALPILAIGAILVLGLEHRASLKEAFDRLKAQIQGPVLWWQTMVTLGFLIALGLMVVRTGNEAPGGVSGVELTVRNTLDRVLPVRPRTKEFLLGHPLLVLTIAYALRTRRRYLPLLAMGAAVGQVSVINTFSHIHTPLMVSAMRVGLGALIGLVLGLILLWVLDRMERAWWPPARA